MEKLLSIIIPVYNVVRYLERCISSLGKVVERDDIEVLIIDDGSTDGSGMIADRMTESDTNIFVYHKENGGLSDARNYGLVRARGKYVMFVDSDDEIDEDNLTTILGDLAVYGCDSVVWNSKIIDEDSIDAALQEEVHSRNDVLNDGSLYTHRDFIMEQLQNDIDIVPCAWMGAFKKDTILNNWLFFENVLHEDELWTIRAFMKCESILYRNLILYKYRLSRNSILRSENNVKRRLRDAIYVLESQYNYFECRVDDEKLKKMLNGMISRKYLAYLGDADYSNIKEVKSRINRKRIYVNSYRKKDKVRAMLMRLSIPLFCYASKSIKTGFVRRNSIK